MNAYRALTRAYPRAFRAEFGEDLVQLFDDLATDRGRVAAWAICGLDLLVTLPRLHLERIMSRSHTTTAINATIVLLAIGGVASILTGIYPGALLFLAAVALAVSQRSSLARAIRMPDTERRRRRLRTAALLATVFVTSYVVFLTTVGDAWTGRETVLAVFGTAAMIGAGAYLVIGLLTPHPPRVAPGGTP